MFLVAVRRTAWKEQKMETESSRKTETVLVLGGTGKTGRRVAERLEARGVPVRVGSRSGEPPFGWEEEATWARAAGRRLCLPHLLPRPRDPRLGGGGALVRKARRGERGPEAGAALGAGRARGRARGAGSAGGGGRQSGRRVDNPALDLVHAELQRGLYAGARVERRDPAPGR